MATDGHGNQQVSVVDGAAYTVVAAGKATNTVISNSPGRLFRVIVTAVGAHALAIFDSATTNSGNVIGSLPANAPLGPYTFSVPSTQGITVAGNATNPGITITWS